MALFASHIRFAIDLIERNHYIPKDKSQYFSGTTYPDSRWLSNIERKLTHVGSIPESIQASNDFKQGWLIHCRYDQIQNELHKMRSFQRDFVPEDKWIYYSALKAVQDMSDVKYITDINLK